MSWNRGPKAFTAGAGGVASWRLVILSSGKLIHNTESATDDTIGVTLSGATENQSVSVALLNSGGTLEMTAAGVINAGAKVFAAPDGKVQALPATAGTYRLIGMAMQAATAENAVIEVMPLNGYGTETV